MTGFAAKYELDEPELAQHSGVALAEVLAAWETYRVDKVIQYLFRLRA